MSQLTVAELVAYLRADTRQFSRGMTGAERQLGQVSKEASATQRALSSMSKTAGIAATIIGGKLVAEMTKAVRQGMQFNALLETSTLQFATLMKDADKARKHVGDLFEFAKKTPFETEPIIRASRMLETFGGAALNNMEVMTMVGDAAAGVTADFGELSVWIGRAYSAIQSGRPFGEAAMRLQELGVLGPKARSEIERLQEQGAGMAEVWGTLTEELERFDGAMLKQATTWAGLTSTLSDSIGLTYAAMTEPIFEASKDVVSAVIAMMDHPVWDAIVADITASLQGVSDVASDMAARFTGWLDRIDVDDAVAGFKSFKDTLGPLVPLIGAFGAASSAAFLEQVPLIGGMLGQVLGPLTGMHVNLIALLLASEDGRAALGSLAMSVGELFAAAAPLVPILSDLTVIASRGVAAAAEVAAVALGGLADGMGAVIEFASENTVVLGALAGVLTAVYAPAIWAAVTANAMLIHTAIGVWALDAGKHLKALALRTKALAGTMGALKLAIAGVAIVGLGALIGSMIGKFRAARDAAKEFAEAINTDLTSDDWDTQAAAIARYDAEMRRLGPAVEDVLARHEGLGGHLKRSFALLPGVSNEYNELTERYHQLSEESSALIVATENAHRAVEVFGQRAGMSAQEVRDLAKANDIDLARGLGSVLPELWKAKTALDASTPATEKMAGAVETLGDEAATATDKVKALKDGMDALIGVNLSAAEAEIRRIESLEAMKKSFDENGNTMDIWTEKGRANASAVNDATRATMDSISALAEQKGLTAQTIPVIERMIGQLLNTKGVTEETRTAIENYARSLGLVPEDIVTMVTADISQAEMELMRLNQLVQRTGVRVANVTGPGGFQQHDGGYAGTGPWVQGALKADEVPAVLQTGEYVLSREQVAAIRRWTSALPRFHDGGPVKSAATQRSGPYDIGFDPAAAIAGLDLSGGLQAAIAQAEQILANFRHVNEEFALAEQRADLIGRVRMAEAAKATASTAEEAHAATVQFIEAVQAVEAFDRNLKQANAEAQAAAQLAELRAELERQVAEQAHAAMIERNRDAYEFAQMSTADQLAELNRRIAAEEQYTDTWMNLVGQRQRIEEQAARASQQLAEQAARELEAFMSSITRAIEGFGSLVGSLSSGDFINAEVITRFLDDRLAQAEQFAATLAQLETLGLSDSLLQELAAAGPNALNLAEALAQGGAELVAYANAQEAALAEVAAEAAAHAAENYGPGSTAAGIGEVNINALNVAIEGILDPNDPGAWRGFVERIRSSLLDLEAEAA